MRKRLLLLLLAMLTIGAQQAFAQMSDDQIVTYIAEGIASGKTERQIGTELMAKGVTTSQLQRLLKAYKSGKMDTSDVPSATKLDGKRTSRKPVVLEDEDGDAQGTKETAKLAGTISSPPRRSASSPTRMQPLLRITSLAPVMKSLSISGA